MAKIENIDILNTRLVALLVGDIGMIKLISDIKIIDSISLYQPFLRIGSFVFILISIVVIVISLFTSNKGGVADPYVLCEDDYWNRDTAELRCFIMSYWAYSIELYDRHIDAKAFRVNLAASFLLLSIGLFCLAHLPFLL